MLAYGNPGRQDDGLGPAAAEVLAGLGLPEVTVEADYQLAVEDAAQIAEHDAVVFIDAARGGTETYTLSRVEPLRQACFSTHHSQPGALLDLAAEIYGQTRPGFLLAIRGYEFDDFEERLSDGARRNLKLAMAFLAGLLEAQGSRRLSALDRHAVRAAFGMEDR